MTRGGHDAGTETETAVCDSWEGTETWTEMVGVILGVVDCCPCLESIIRH